jgi:hypothetical protein
VFFQACGTPRGMKASARPADRELVADLEGDFVVELPETPASVLQISGFAEAASASSSAQTQNDSPSRSTTARKHCTSELTATDLK